MRKFLLIVTLLLFTLILFGQKNASKHQSAIDGPGQEREMMKLSSEIAKIAKSKRMSKSERQTKVVNVIGQYLANTKSINENVRPIKNLESEKDGKQLMAAMGRITELIESGKTIEIAQKEIGAITDPNIMSHVNNILEMRNMEVGDNETLEYDAGKSEFSKEQLMASRGALWKKCWGKFWLYASPQWCKEKWWARWKYSRNPSCNCHWSF